MSNSLLDPGALLCGHKFHSKNALSLDLTTFDVFAGLASDGIAVSIPYSSRIFTIRTSRTGPIIVPPGIAATTWD